MKEEENITSSISYRVSRWGGSCVGDNEKEGRKEEKAGRKKPLQKPYAEKTYICLSMKRKKEASGEGEGRR